MQRVSVSDVELEYRDEGQGEPVLLVHGAGLPDALRPVAAELARRYRVITPHRVGHAGSSRPVGEVSIPDQAGHLLGLLSALGVGRAHVVGHSFGAAVALQMAHDAPSAVATLVLLEMPDLTVPAAEDFMATAVGPAFGAFAAGDGAGGLDRFFAGICGADNWAGHRRSLPEDTWERASADAATFFTVEAPAMQQWSADAAPGGGQPALVVMGERSPEVHAIYTEGHEAMLKRLPSAESAVIPGARHMLMFDAPAATAEAIEGFLARHPL
jgi:pimeloyl-ACP methyl ester carboxylesterase